MRLTDQRLSIWKQINKSKKHLDVENIFFNYEKKGPMFQELRFIGL